MENFIGKLAIHGPSLWLLLLEYTRVTRCSLTSESSASDVGGFWNKWSLSFACCSGCSVVLVWRWISPSWLKKMQLYTI